VRAPAWALAGAVVAALGAGAFAQPAGPEGDFDPRHLFVELDEDRDGVLTVDEALAEVARRWEEALASGDFDGDGRLSRSEALRATAAFHGHGPSHGAPYDGGSRGFGVRQRGPGGGGADAAAAFRRLDVNGDGRWAAAEATERDRPRFRALLAALGKEETSLSLAEYVRATRLVAGEPADEPQGIAGTPGRDGGGGLGRGTGGAPALDVDLLFRRYDADRDGRLYLEEVHGPERAELGRIMAMLGLLDSGIGREELRGALAAGAGYRRGAGADPADHPPTNTNDGY
jgi:hypothetical protein